MTAMLNKRSSRRISRVSQRFHGPVIDTPERDELKALRTVRAAINSYVAFGTVDGPGVRFVLFMQGCPLRCLYCHNPDSVTCGGKSEVWTAEQALEKILRYRGFIKSGGVTLSGGEPLMQPEFVYALTTLLHEAGLHVAVDTSGCLKPASVKKAIDAADMLLLDIKAVDPEVSVKLTGQDNANAFATLDYCEKAGKPVWIRHVLLRGYTLEEKQLDELAKRLKQYSCIEMIELLPFHKYGEEKWKSIGRQYQLADVKATTEEETAWAKSFFTRQGLKVLE